jgi:arabinose-5-phosphate isomerase
MNLSVAISEVTESTIQFGADAIREQARVLYSLADSLDKSFDSAARAILETTGHVVISGVGKSALVGRKLAATFSSTGTPSFFFQPNEAIYGGVGVIGSGNILLLISESGERKEILKLIPPLKRQRGQIIAIVGNKNSTLAREADIVLAISDMREKSTSEFLPSAITLTTMSLGDALAATLMRLRDIQFPDFGMFETENHLGKSMITRVRDMMRKRSEKDFPIVDPKTSIKQTIWVMSRGKMGLALVMEKDYLVGVITDSDLREAMMNNSASIFKSTAADIMNSNPLTVFEEAPWSEAEKIMNKYKLYALVAVDKDVRVTGVVEIF